MDTMSKLWNKCNIHEKCAKLPASYWSNALAGEVGEFANWIKKHDRDIRDWDAAECAEEHADIFIYWVLMAKRMGWSLDDVIAEIYAKLQEVEYNAKSYENDLSE